MSDQHLPLKKRRGTVVIVEMENRNKQQQPKEKKVRFNTIVHVKPIPKISVADDISGQWYNNDDLCSFKAKGRRLSSLYRKVIKNAVHNNNTNTNGTLLVTCTMAQSPPKQVALNMSNFRGVEDYTLQRQKQKLVANRCVLYGQKLGLNPDELASVYQHANTWSNEVAMVQAIHDFDAVYPPQDHHYHRRLPFVHQLIPPPTCRFGKESFNALRKKRPVVVTKKLRQSSSSSSGKSAVTALKRTVPDSNSGNAINIGNNEASRRVRRRLSLEHTLQ